jgi:hypothetical protein
MLEEVILLISDEKSMTCDLTVWVAIGGLGLKL